MSKKTTGAASRITTPDGKPFLTHREIAIGGDPATADTRALLDARNHPSRGDRS
ncbi:MAG: hypothetical protein IMY75_08130 [Chloroflexi bacterium]|nr:hypothetical protein [Chloroflexota bacterium]